MIFLKYGAQPGFPIMARCHCITLTDVVWTVSVPALAIQQLQEKQRLVFNLRYYDEMPYQEMSRILETSEGALKASYHHAARKIEEFIKNY